MEFIPVFLTANTRTQSLVTNEHSLHLCFNSAADVHNYVGAAF